ncbi:MAG: hypothetical protein ACM3MI_01180 [Clostridiales bacterium]
MNKKYEYNQNMDIKYGHQEIIDVPSIVSECKEKWFNQTLTKINGSVARIGIVEGEYHWHTLCVYISETKNNKKTVNL